MLIQPKYSTLSQEEQNRIAEAPVTQRERIETLPGYIQGYEEILEKNKHGPSVGDLPSYRLGSKTAEALMREIRWANLGWAYQASPHFCVYSDSPGGR